MTNPQASACYTQHFIISKGLLAIHSMIYISPLHPFNHYISISFPLRVVSSECRKARRGREESPCGDWVSETATLWRPALEAPRWVSSHFQNQCCVSTAKCLLHQDLLSAWMIGDRKGTHFTTRDLKSIGFHFCDTLLDYCDPDPIKVRDNADDWEFRRIMKCLVLYV